MERKGFIGGSDCVKIMQGEWLKLWQIKTGRVESDDLSDNIAVQLGIHTEDFNLGWFEKQYNCVLSHHQSESEEMIGNVPAKGTIDAKWNDAIIEAKHTNSYNNMDSVIEFYMPQIQMYAHMADAKGAYLSVIFGNNKWEGAYVSYNEEYFILCGQWCRTSGVTFYGMKNRLVLMSRTSQSTRLRWTKWSSETPAVTMSSSPSPMTTSRTSQRPKHLRLLRNP